jgi:hypothetical protein
MGLFGSKGTSIPRLNEIWNKAPSGALSDDDMAFAERSLSRTLEGVHAGTEEATRGARRRYQARGIEGPALEQTLADVTQAGELGRVKAGEGYQDLLQSIRMGNKTLEQQRNMFAWGSEVDASKAKTQRHYAQQAGFYNSLIDLGGNLMGAAKSIPSAAAGGGAMTAGGHAAGAGALGGGGAASGAGMLPPLPI